MQLRTLAEAPVESRRVLLRAGLNVPVDGAGKPTDEFRLRRALGTLKALSGRGARTVVIAHLGREGQSLRRVAEACSALIGLPVRFSDRPLAQALIEAMALKNGEILMLENIRRFPGEEQNDISFARELAALGEIYVNDAFADSHRGHSSIVGVAQMLPSYAGLLMEEEVEHLSRALTPPSGSLAVIGGAKFETKEPLIRKLLGSYGKICVGGAIGNDLLKARGVGIGESKISDTEAPEDIAQDARVLVPLDGVLEGLNGTREALLTEVRDDERIVDAGTRTAELWSAEAAGAPFVLWNGPLGVYEDGFTAATDALAEAIVHSSAPAVVGGGDTIAALAQFSFDEKRVFCSTGGGAMLEFLADGTLPGLEPLKK